MPKIIRPVVSCLISAVLVFNAPLAAGAAKASDELQRSLATVTAACKNPRQVSYDKRVKDKKGRWVYPRYLKKPNGEKFMCEKVGVGAATKLPPPPPNDPNTEASDNTCVNCEKPGVTKKVQELAAQVELAPQCKANPQSAADCTKDVMCTITRDVLKVASPTIGIATSRMKLPVCKSHGAGAGCGDKIALGLANGIKDLIVGIGYLGWGALKAAGQSAKGVLYDLPVARIKDSVNKLRNLFGGKEVHKTDHTMSLAHLWIQKMSKSKFMQFILHPIQFLSDFVKNLFQDSLEHSKNMANCQVWSGLPLFSSCKQAANAWGCLNCEDKLETVCGMIGFAMTDLASVFFAGVGVGKVAGKVGQGLYTLSRKTVKLSVKYLGKSTTRKILTATAAVGTAAVSAASTAAQLAAPVLKAISVIEKVPGFKNLGKLEDTTFKLGVKTGGGNISGPLSRRASDAAASSRSSAQGPPTVTLVEPENFKTALQSSDEAIAEISATLPETPKVDRDDFVDNNSKRKVVSEEQNSAFMKSNNLGPEKKPNNKPNPKSRNYVFRNTEVKGNNDVHGFDHSTAITTTYVERVSQKLDVLAKKYEKDIEVVRYEGSNRLEVEIEPKKGETLPKSIDVEMANIYKRASVEQHLYLKQNNLVRDTDRPIDAFKFGSGPDAIRANLAARMNKYYDNQLATFDWDHRPTQANLETVFNQAKSVHESVKRQYGQTKLFDADTGRINPTVADIISKTDDPKLLIEKLKDIHEFRGPDGKLLSEAEQFAKASELMEYVDYTRVFGVEYYGPRTILDPDNANTASTGADVSGQNGRNISHNTTVFDADFKDVANASEKAETAATEEFNLLVNSAISNREKVLKDRGYRVETLRTGDDIAMVIKDANGHVVDDLPKEVLRELGDCNDGVVCLRDAYVPAKVETTINGQKMTPNKQDVVDKAHKLEKELRGLLPKDVYGPRNFWIEVSPDGQMTLQMSYPSQTTAKEILELRALEEKAQKVFREMVEKKNPEDILGLRAARATDTGDDVVAQIKFDEKRIRESQSDDVEFESMPILAKPDRPIKKEEVQLAKLLDQMNQIKNKPEAKMNYKKLYELNRKAVDIIEAELKRKGIKYRVQDEIEDMLNKNNYLDAQATTKSKTPHPDSLNADRTNGIRLSRQYRRIVLEPGPRNPQILNNLIEKYNVEIVLSPQFKSSSPKTSASHLPRDDASVFYYPIENIFDDHFGHSIPAYHEARHISHRKKRNAGIDQPYNVVIRADKGKTIHDHTGLYDTKLNAEELSTFGRDVNTTVSKKNLQAPRERYYVDGKIYQELPPELVRAQKADWLTKLSQATLDAVPAAKSQIKSHPESVVFRISNNPKTPSSAIIPYIKDGQRVGQLEVDLVRLNSQNADRAVDVLGAYLDRVEKAAQRHNEQAKKVLANGPTPPKDRWELIYTPKPKKKPIAKMKSNDQLELPLELEMTPMHEAPGTYTVQRSQLVMIAQKIEKLPNDELIGRIDGTFDLEIENTGSLTGIRSEKENRLNQFVEDMSRAYSKDEYEKTLNDLDSDLKEKILEKYTPRSMEHLRNYLGNALGPYLDILESKNPASKVRPSTQKFPPDFRIQQTLLFKEIVHRLKKNPKQVFKDLNLEYPKNDEIFQRSLERLDEIFEQIDLSP